MDRHERVFLLFTAPFVSLWIPEWRPRHTLAFGLQATAGIPPSQWGAMSPPALGAVLVFGASSIAATTIPPYA